MVCPIDFVLYRRAAFIYYAIGITQSNAQTFVDIQKITMYGDKEGYGFVQKDQAPVGHIDWDTTELDQAGHLQRTNQITNIDKPPQGEMVTDLFIEGNSIKVPIM